MKKEKEHIVLKGGAEEGRQEDRKVIEQKVLACVGELEHELTALFLKKSILHNNLFLWQRLMFVLVFLSANQNRFYFQSQKWKIYLI